MDESESATIPIDLGRIPPELLYRMFCHAALDIAAPMNHIRQLVTITHVCHRWRTAALQYQHLWTYIYLPCHEEYLQVALQRCGDSPLQVFLPHPDKPSGGLSFRSAESSLDRGLSRVLQETHRICRLSLGSLGAMSMSAVASCCSLEILDIASAGYDDAYANLERIKALLRGLPRLSVLRLPLYVKDRKVHLDEKSTDTVPLPNLRELELEGYGVPCMLLLESLIFPPSTKIAMTKIRWQYPYSGADGLPATLSRLIERCSWTFDFFELQRDGRTYRVSCDRRSSDGSERRPTLAFTAPATVPLLHALCGSLALDSISEVILCNLYILGERENIADIARIVGGFRQLRVLWFIKCTVATIEQLLGQLVAAGRSLQLDDLSIVEPGIRTCPARTTHDTEECTNCMIRLRNTIEGTLIAGSRPLPYLWIQGRWKMKKKNLRFLLEVADMVEYDCTEHPDCSHLLGRGDD